MNHFVDLRTAIFAVGKERFGGAGKGTQKLAFDPLAAEEALAYIREARTQIIEASKYAKYEVK